MYICVRTTSLSIITSKDSLQDEDNEKSVLGGSMYSAISRDNKEEQEPLGEIHEEGMCYCACSCVHPGLLPSP